MMSEWVSPSGFNAGQLWLGAGWQDDSHFGLSPAGVLLDSAAGPTEQIGRWVLPGMPNLHSHAFQRAMAGLAERRSKAEQAWSEKQRRAQQRREEAQQSAQPQRGQPLPVPPAGASPLGR